MDFKTRLAQVKQQHAKHTPSLIPTAQAKAVLPMPKDEEIIPSLDDLGLSPAKRAEFADLVRQHLELGQQERAAKKTKEVLSARIKAFCSQLGAERLLVDSAKVAYYNVPRSAIKANLLLEHGVSPKTIADCTKTTDNWTLRITAAGEPDDAA